MPRLTSQRYSSSIFSATKPGVFAPEMLPVETRRAIIAGIRTHSVKITHKTTIVKQNGEGGEEF